MNELERAQHAKQDALVLKAEYAACVIGRDTEFVLVPITGPEPIADVVTDAIKNRGLQFCGLLSIVNGEAHAACEPNREAQAVMILAVSKFARLYTDRRKANAAEWLNQLWQLPDTRP